MTNIIILHFEKIRTKLILLTSLAAKLKYYGFDNFRQSYEALLFVTWTIFVKSYISEWNRYFESWLCPAIEFIFKSSDLLKLDIRFPRDIRRDRELKLCLPSVLGKLAVTRP